MIVECPSCHTNFPVDPKKVPYGGVHARCSVCSEVFFVDEPPLAPEPSEVAPEELEAPPGEGWGGAEETAWDTEPEVPVEAPAIEVAPEEPATFDEEAAAFEEPAAAFEEEPVTLDEPPVELQEGPVTLDGPSVELEEERVTFDEPTVGFEEEPVSFEEPAAVWEEEPAFEAGLPIGVPHDQEEPAFEAGLPIGVPHDQEEPAADPEPGPWAEPEVEEEAAPDVGSVESPDSVFQVEPFYAPELPVDTPTTETEPVEFEPEEEDSTFEPESFVEGEAPFVVETPVEPEVSLPDDPAPFDGGAALEEGVEMDEVVVEEPPSDPLPTPAFGRRDPEEKAQRLARVLVSDIILYNPDRHQQAMESGRIREEFEEEIQKSWNEYVDQVGESVASSTSYFNDALNEILARGERIF
ncbi:zinc-ribbon domain-containing protein [Gemmatimonadota bacterium]